jgi:hypothetical protein
VQIGCCGNVVVNVTLHAVTTPDPIVIIPRSFVPPAKTDGLVPHKLRTGGRNIGALDHTLAF